MLVTRFLIGYWEKRKPFLSKDLIGLSLNVYYGHPMILNRVQGAPLQDDLLLFNLSAMPAVSPPFSLFSSP